MWFLCHSTTFLYTSVTIQTLILHTVTQHADFHGKSHEGPRSMIVNTWLSYSANKCYNKCSRLRPLVCADLNLNEFKQIRFIGLIGWLLLSVANIYRSVTSITHMRNIHVPMFKVWRKHNTYCTWRLLPENPPCEYPLIAYICRN